MKLGELRQLLADVPDDADIDFKDGNFGGKGDDLTHHIIEISPDGKTVLIDPPFWEPVG